MKLKDILSTEKFGNVASTSEKNTAILKEIISEMSNPDEQHPQSFYNKWIRNEDSVIETLSKSLVRDYPIERIYGEKTKTIFLSSLGTFKLPDYIKTNYNTCIDFTKSKLLDYNIVLYRDLSIITTAILVNKYKPESLYREHIIFIGLKVLFTYFTLYRDNAFLVNLKDHNGVIGQLLEMDMEVFDNIAIKLGFKHAIITNNHVPPRILTKEQIMEFIDEGDSQTTIKKKIMKWCPCGERKARELMRKYGLTDQKYTRRDYRRNELPEDEGMSKS